MSDKTLIEWFLEEQGRTRFAVYEAGLFEVEPRDIFARQLEDNNRGRVITIAYHVATHSPDDTKVTCIADRDFDPLLNTEHRCRGLLFTDYTCMLMYTLNERVLSKFLRFKVSRFQKPASRVIKEISATLESLFAVRLANYLLHSGLKPVTWQDSCVLDRDGVRMNQNDYINRYLNKNRAHADKQHFVTQIEECKSWMHLDLRLQVNGHDYIAILIWYISHHPRFRAFARLQEETVERDLFACLELQDLGQQRLFRQLLGRITA